MSTEPEDSVLEQALRHDLPSVDTEARLRRRLLAAGVAVGNGIATTTAAASGAAVSNAAATGLVTKVLGLSWGVKLGLAAAVTIPTLGLWLDDRGLAPQSSARHGAVRAAATAAKGAPLAPSPALPALAAVAAEPDVGVAAAAERAPARRDRPAVEPATVGVAEAPRLAEHPSQSNFATAPAAPLAAVQAPSTLADETRLLDAAFAELTAGNRARAAALIAEHESRYPQGLLKKERERAKTRLSELSRGE
jgi:hypothetical protein